MSRLVSFIYKITEKKNSQENKKKKTQTKKTTPQQNPTTRLIQSGGQEGLDSDLVFILTEWIKMPYKSTHEKQKSGREAAASLQLLVIAQSLKNNKKQKKAFKNIAKKRCST